MAGGELQAIWRHSRVYGLGRVLNRIAAFLLIPILVHLLPAEEWGVYSLVLVVGQVLLVVPGILTDTMLRLSFDHADEAGRNRVVATTLSASLILAVPLLVLAYPLAVMLCLLLFGDLEHLWPFVIGNVVLVFELLFEVELDYFRLTKRSTTFVLSTLCRSLLQFAGSLGFVALLGLGATGVVLGHLVGVGVVSLVVAVGIARRTGLRPSARIARDILRLGLPLVPAWLAKSSLEFLDRTALNLMATTASVGVYALGAKLADQVRMLLTGPFADIWGVSLYEIAGDHARAREFNRVLVYFLFVLATVVLGLALFAPEVVAVIAPPEYAAAAAVVPILALAKIVELINYHFEIGILDTKATRSLPVINWGAALASVAVLALLVPRIGITGAAVAMLTAQVVRQGLSVAYTARDHAVMRLFPWRDYGLILIFGIACYGLGAGLAGRDVSWHGMLIKAAVVAVFVAVCVAGAVFSPAERGAMMRFARARLGRRAAARA